MIAVAVTTCAWLVQPVSGASSQHPTVRSHTVFFVPIGIESSLPRLHNTAEWFREALGLDVVVADRVEPSPAAYDPNRGQFVAERLEEQLATQRPQLVGMTAATVIGLTDLDMYMAGYARWQFVFSYRGASATAVVSYARMDPRNFGQRDNEDLLQSRLRKMVAKDVGMLAYGLPATRDPRSLLYNGILGLEELDFIEEDFSRAGMAPTRRP